VLYQLSYGPREPAPTSNFSGARRKLTSGVHSSRVTEGT
jgi:hypothetical protein